MAATKSQAIDAQGSSTASLEPTGYIFVDEMWRERTVTAAQIFYWTDGPGSELKRSRPAPGSVTIGSIKGAPRTIAEQAEADDLELWASSSGVADYEEKKQAIYEKKRLDREAFVESQGSFGKFPLLPAELRMMIWKMASEEPMVVTIKVSKRRRRAPGRGWCGTPILVVDEYSAMAMLPPLMLVNRESHEVASARYKRAFRGVKGNGGVLAAYPVVLKGDERAVVKLGSDDKALVQEYDLRSIYTRNR